MMSCSSLQCAVTRRSTSESFARATGPGGVEGRPAERSEGKRGTQSQWLQPVSILTGRMAKISAEFTF
jgi:hypothetical protein